MNISRTKIMLLARKRGNKDTPKYEICGRIKLRGKSLFEAANTAIKLTLHLKKKVSIKPHDMQQLEIIFHYKG